MVTHLAMERPKPLRAPYLPAGFWSKQMLMKNPIQLKKKAIMNALKNMHSLPISWFNSCADIGESEASAIARSYKKVPRF